ncbi:hypothetical protein DEI81_07985 [Curtobacterium sp. MCBD17_013]|uniref:hypothetical protein n=1 Tax=Curtobacterium sp. MCBD17_013 TaxID=2175668 RepID=UPI000DA824F8|nr:hypothetical protein [Curtobacterium sp. MCBD17_013]PZF63337.1 hypothetical protein DEI81_07985 [Curtobacterium sp. MCBD17_013]
MTDARLPERYLSDRRVLRLSADEYRAWSFATLWSVSNRTDGLILADEVPLVPFLTDEIAATLVTRELWTVVDDGWLISDFEQNQTSRHELEVLENARRREREKKQRQRAGRGSSSGDTPSFTDVPGDVPGGLSRGTSRGRVPEDSTGQEGQAGRDQESWFVDNETGEVSAPPAVVPAAWGSRSCVVCSKPIAVDSPVPWCGVQDDNHRNYMSAASAA